MIKYYFYRYFWWLKFPRYWWKRWRYTETKAVPFRPGETNYVLGYNNEPRIYARCYYKSDVPPDIETLYSVGGKPMDKVWCAGFPPIKPQRPMPKGTVGLASNQ